MVYSVSVDDSYSFVLSLGFSMLALSAEHPCLHPLYLGESKLYNRVNGLIHTDFYCNLKTMFTQIQTPSLSRREINFFSHLSSLSTYHLPLASCKQT